MSPNIKNTPTVTTRVRAAASRARAAAARVRAAAARVRAAAAAKLQAARVARARAAAEAAKLQAARVAKARATAEAAKLQAARVAKARATAEAAKLQAASAAALSRELKASSETAAAAYKDKVEKAAAKELQAASAVHPTKEVVQTTKQSLTSWHFKGRSEKNKDLPDFTTAASRGSDWRKMSLSESIFHDNGKGLPETKFIHEDGREVVYDGDTNKIVTDSRFSGTYNYVTPTPSPTNVQGAVSWAVKGIGHIVVDVIPYAIGGNVRGPN